jgi:tetratricopeptide (TPR) repeat protein
MENPVRFLQCSLIFLLVWLSFTAEASSDGAQIKAALQRRHEAELISAQIIDLVRSADYESAEKRLAGLLREKPTGDDGHRLLERVYTNLAANELGKVWDIWCSKRPQSHFPFAIRGMYFYEKARFLDGANQTLLLNERQRRAFNVYLNGARRDLEKAHQLAPDDPGPPATLTALSIQLNSPRIEMERWYQRSVDNDPAWFAAHRAKLMYLSPWRYGSEQLMHQFALECYNDDQPGTIRYIVALDYLKLRVDRLGKTLNAERFLLRADIYSMMIHGLERYIRAFPDSPQIEQYLELQTRALEHPYVAVAAFNDILASDPGDTAARKGRSEANLALKQYGEAEKDLHLLQQNDSDRAFALSKLGFISFQRDRSLEQSGLFYDQALQAETGSYPRKWIYFERGSIFQSLAKHQRAIEDFSAALNEDLLFEEAYIGRAISRYNLEDLQGALADLVVIKSTIRGRLSTRARSLINTYLKPKQISPLQRYQNLAAGSGAQPRALAGGSSEDDDQGGSSENDRAQAVDPQAREILLRGLRLYYQGAIEQARSDFYRVISRNPNEAKAYFMLGTIAEQHEINLPAAQVFYRQASRLAPDVTDYTLALARCLYRQKKFSRASALLSNFLENRQQATPGAAQVYFLRGLSFEALGLIPEALQDMLKTLQLEPQHKAARQFIRDQKAYVAQIEQQAPETAAANVQKPEQPDQVGPENQQQTSARVDALIEEGRSHLVQGDVKQAKIAYFKALRLDPERSDIHHLLGRLFFEYEQDYGKALVYYNQAIERDSTLAHYYHDRASIHFFFKQYAAAKADFSAVLELQPDNFESLYYRGVCNHMLGLKDEARADFNKIRESGDGLDLEIERFRNAWNAEVEQFLNTET